MILYMDKGGNQMADSSLAFMAECIDCKEKIAVTPSNLKKEEYRFEGKQSMWITHYDCPKCGRIHYCQIDNEKTNSLLVETGKILARVAKYKSKSQDIPKKLQSKYSKNSKDLASTRRQLMTQYNNQWFEDADGHSIKMEFVQ